jgi:hypothetical protein
MSNLRPKSRVGNVRVEWGGVETRKVPEAGQSTGVTATNYHLPLKHRPK